jgi:hypothetical protein
MVKHIKYDSGAQSNWSPKHRSARGRGGGEGGFLKSQQLYWQQGTSLDCWDHSLLLSSASATKATLYWVLNSYQVSKKSALNRATSSFGVATFVLFANMLAVTMPNCPLKDLGFYIFVGRWPHKHSSIFSPRNFLWKVWMDPIPMPPTLPLICTWCIPDRQNPTVGATILCWSSPPTWNEWQQQGQERGESIGDGA